MYATHRSRDCRPAIRKRRKPLRSFEILERRNLLTATTGVLYELFTDPSLTTRGLTGSFVDSSLRLVDEADWRVTQAIVGTRVDPELFFPGSSLGDRNAVGVTGGTDSDWDEFSVQWDGMIRILDDDTRLTARSEGGSRVWIDLDGDGSFAGDNELLDNNWGEGLRGTSSLGETVPPGIYSIRVQFEDDSGPNTLSLYSNEIPSLADDSFQFFTDETLSIPGLWGSYVDGSLRAANEIDWRETQTIAGQRIDESIDFDTANWGQRGEVGITSGSDSNWSDYSVQWDGVVRILKDGAHLATQSDDGSRMWIDLDRDGLFDPVTELFNNNWGNGQTVQTGSASPALDAGVYSVRIQYEEASGGNIFRVVALAAPQIRVAYVIPSNRTPQPGGAAALAEYLPRLQRWFAEQMDRNGFGPQTFLYETLPNSVLPVVHQVHVGTSDDSLRQDLWPTTLQAAEAAGVPVWSDGQIWLVVPETVLQDPDGSITGGVALGAGFGSGRGGGVAMLGADMLFRLTGDMLSNDAPYAGASQPAIGPYPLVQDVSFPWFEGTTFSSIASSAQGAAAHELGHAFGLGHDFRNDGNFRGNLMGNGLRGTRGSILPESYPQDEMRLSYAAALALSVSRYFNPEPAREVNPPIVSISRSGAIATVDGLLEVPFTASDDTQLSAALLRRNGHTIGEMRLEGTTAARSFLTPYFEPEQEDTYEVTVYDSEGNRSRQSVSITPSDADNRAPRPFVKLSQSWGIAGEPVIMDASSTDDPDHPIESLRVEWDLDGDGIFDTPPDTLKVFSATYAEPGTFAISARITDPSGAQSVSAPVALKISVGHDYGDAPSATESGLPSSYPTTRSQDGARHVLGSLFLGNAVDAEPDGQPAASAGAGAGGGDDQTGEHDEDGVIGVASLIATTSGSTSSLSVVASQSGFIDAWIDFNRDGDWDDASEQIATRIPVAPGNNLLSFRIPPQASPGETVGRFRLSLNGGLSPRGAAFDGEVEDHSLTLLDGATSSGVAGSVRLPMPGAVDLLTNGDDVIVLADTSQLLRARRGQLAHLVVTGSSGDDGFDIVDESLLASGLLFVNGAGGRDALRLPNGDQSLDLRGLDGGALRQLEVIDISGSGDNRLTLDAASVARISGPAASLAVQADLGDTVAIGSPWTLEGVRRERGRIFRVLRHDDVELLLHGPANWQNPVNRRDVNNNGITGDPVGDILPLINELNRPSLISPAGELPEFPVSGAPFYDVNGDGLLTPAGDVLPQFNYVNSLPPWEAEGELATNAPEWFTVTVNHSIAVEPLAAPEARSLRPDLGNSPIRPTLGIMVPGPMPASTSSRTALPAAAVDQLALDELVASRALGSEFEGVLDQLLQIDRSNGRFSLD